jgi:hypothetical protein
VQQLVINHTNISSVARKTYHIVTHVRLSTAYTHSIAADFILALNDFNLIEEFSYEWHYVSRFYKLKHSLKILLVLLIDRTLYWPILPVKNLAPEKMTSLAHFPCQLRLRSRSTETCTLSHNLLWSVAFTNTVCMHNMKLFTSGNLHRILLFAVLRQFASVICVRH